MTKKPTWLQSTDSSQTLNSIHLFSFLNFDYSSVLKTVDFTISFDECEDKTTVQHLVETEGLLPSPRTLVLDYSEIYMMLRGTL